MELFFAYTLILIVFIIYGFIKRSYYVNTDNNDNDIGSKTLSDHRASRPPFNRSASHQIAAIEAEENRQRLTMDRVFSRHSSSLNAKELRSMDLDQLKSMNNRQKKNTDRYWREIFRRHNQYHLPDTVNLQHLATQNALTVLEEFLPKNGFGPSEHFTIHTGSEAMVQSQVIRYLRKRYTTSSDYEINIDQAGDTIRLTHAIVT